MNWVSWLTVNISFSIPFTQRVVKFGVSSISYLQRQNITQTFARRESSIKSDPKNYSPDRPDKFWQSDIVPWERFSIGGHRFPLVPGRGVRVLFLVIQVALIPRDGTSGLVRGRSGKVATIGGGEKPSAVAVVEVSGRTPGNRP